MKKIIQKEYSTNTVSVNKSRMVSNGHVALMVDLRRAHTILTINQHIKYTIWKAQMSMVKGKVVPLQA
jgi:hypothetical protein